MSQKDYKYKINECLLRLPIAKYRIALHSIPAQLEIHPNTFNTYRGIELNSKKDIPHEIVDKLEKLFSLQPGELQNYITDTRPFGEQTERLADSLDKTAAELGLTK